MSNVTAPVAAQATLPASFRKVIVNVNVDGLLNTALAGQSGNVTPSMLRFSKDSAKAAMGGKSTPVSFMQGLVFLTCAYAWGQGKVDALVHGLPSHAAYALTASCAVLKGGAGCTAETLAAAVKHGFDAMIALPSKQKTEKAENGADISPLAVANGATVEGEIIRDDNGRAMETAAEKAARETAEKKAAFEAETVARITNMPDEQAIFLIRAMAARYGFTLTNIKKAA